MAAAAQRALRSDIQALRAVAVLLVIAYHYNIGPVKGGFLGVDIFFVISGFVITQRLLGYHGSFLNSLHDFYLKRAKRLLPSSLLVIALTAIFARILLPAISLHQIAKESLAASLFVPNLYFAHQQNNYMNQGMDPSPYLHFWSLGVEEQFYLLWPLLLLVIFRKRLLWIIITLPSSVVISFLLTHQNAISGFYQPWTRAWEFIAGALLVFIPSGLTPKLKGFTACLGWGGVAISALSISSSQQTPGFTTIAAVLSAALVIYANAPISAKTGLPYIGNISYTLYLVHWPLFVILTSRYSGLNLTERCLIAFGATALAGFIYRYFENPLRFQTSANKLWQFGLGVIVVAIASFTILDTGASAQSGKISISREEPILYADGCHLGPDISTPKPNCFFGDTSSKSVVILVGDSHAAMHFPGLNLLAQHNHWKLLALTKSSCPAAELTTIAAGKIDTACIAWEKNLPALFQRYHAQYIFLAGATEHTYPLADTSQAYSLAYGKGFTTILDAAIASGAQPVLLSDTSWPGTDSPSCIVRNSSHLQKCALTPPHSAATAAVKAIALANGAIVIDSSSILCTNGICPAVFGNTNVYRDYSHISVATSLRLEPFYAHSLGVQP